MVFANGALFVWEDPTLAVVLPIAVPWLLESVVEVTCAPVESDPLVAVAVELMLEFDADPPWLLIWNAEHMLCALRTVVYVPFVDFRWQ